MKKLIIAVLAVVVLAGGAFALTRTKTSKTESNQSSQTQNEPSASAVNACDVLTDSVAKQVLGDNAKKSDTTLGNNETNDVAVSNCTYTAEINPNAIGINNIRGAGLLARTGKTRVGAESNKSQFGSGAPAGSVYVDGIGDDANFNPTTGQLNVLQGGNWYIVSSYTGNPTSGTQEAAVQLAKLLNFK